MNEHDDGNDTCDRLVYWLSLIPAAGALLCLRQALAGGSWLWWLGAGWLVMTWASWLWISYEIRHAPQ